MVRGNIKITTYAFLGGISWFIHFLLIYALGEFGCVAQKEWTSSAIIGVSIPLLLLSLYSLYKSFRFSQGEQTETPYTLATFGIINNAIFSFIIVYQIIPLFYFERQCL